MRDDKYYLLNSLIRRLGYGREPQKRHPEQAHGNEVRIHESQIAPIAQMEHAVDAAATLRQWGWNAVYDADPDTAVWTFASYEQRDAFEKDFNLVIVPMLSGGGATRTDIDERLQGDLTPDEDDDDLDPLPLGIPCAG